jgi:hypothetical protein
MQSMLVRLCQVYDSARVCCVYCGAVNRAGWAKLLAIYIAGGTPGTHLVGVQRFPTAHIAPDWVVLAIVGWVVGRLSVGDSIFPICSGASISNRASNGAEHRLTRFFKARQEFVRIRSSNEEDKVPVKIWLIALSRGKGLGLDPILSHMRCHLV